MQQKDIAAAISRNPSVGSREITRHGGQRAYHPDPRNGYPGAFRAHAFPVGAGTNENTNGIVREYFPKGTEITRDIHYLQTVADEMNDWPPAMLGFRTPAEVFAELLRADNPGDNLSVIASTG
jgi:IS30 family transposase